MVQLIKDNLRSTILLIFVVLLVVQVILPTFYDFLTSAIEIAILWFILFKVFGQKEVKK